MHLWFKRSCIAVAVMAQLNDTDVEALYHYLKTLPAREGGTR